MRHSSGQALRPLALVRLRAEWIDTADQLPFRDDMPLIYLGEIPNMAGHGVFAGHRSGRVYSGFHIDRFEELPPEAV